MGDAFSQWNARRKDLFLQIGGSGCDSAAILLHPEARSSGVSAKFLGILREPTVKGHHVTRAWEYSDAHDRTNCLQTATGCRWAVLLPRSLGLQLLRCRIRAAMQDMSESGAETESESKPEWEPTTPMAPESQILTPSLFVGYLNTIFSLVKVVGEHTELWRSIFRCWSQCLQECDTSQFMNWLSAGFQRGLKPLPRIQHTVWSRVRLDTRVASTARTWRTWESCEDEESDGTCRKGSRCKVLPERNEVQSTI